MRNCRLFILLGGRRSRKAGVVQPRKLLPFVCFAQIVLLMLLASGSQADGLQANTLYDLKFMESKGFTLDDVKSKILIVLLSASRYTELKNFGNSSPDPTLLALVADLKQTVNGDYMGEIVLRGYVNGKLTTNVTSNEVLKFFVYGKDKVILKTPALNFAAQLQALEKRVPINISVGAYRTSRGNPEYLTQFSATDGGYRLLARDPDTTLLTWQSRKE